MQQTVTVFSADFANDPVGAILHYHAARTRPAFSEVSYLEAVTALEADFRLLGSPSARLEKDHQGLKLIAKRPDGAEVSCIVDEKKGVIHVVVVHQKKRVSYVLDCQNGKVLNFEEVAELTAADLSNLDKALSVEITREQFPGLFSVAGIRAGTDTVSVVSEAKGDDELAGIVKNYHDKLKTTPPASPILAKVYLAVDGVAQASLDIIRVSPDYDAADLAGNSRRLGLYPRDYNCYGWKRCHRQPAARPPSQHSGGNESKIVQRVSCRAGEPVPGSSFAPRVGNGDSLPAADRQGSGCGDSLDLNVRMGALTFLSVFSLL